MFGKKKIAIRVLSLLLAAALLVPANVSAASVGTVEPRASYYLNSYSAYVYPAGYGKIQVWFTVTGAGYMDELGCLTISLYESTDNVNWTWKRSFAHDTTSGMLSYDDNYHSGHINYWGVAGRYYKAYVCIWGGKDGEGDTRYFWTSPKQAT